MFEDLITPEGMAFGDFVDSTDANPYPYETEDHARYDAAMAKLKEALQ